MSTTQQPHPMTIPSLAGALARKQNKKPAASGPVSTEAAQDAGAQLAEVQSNLTATEKETTRTPRKVTSQPEAAGPIRGVEKTKSEVPTRLYSQPMSLYLPRSIHQVLMGEAAARRSTNTALILQAINATHLRVGEGLPTATDSAPTDLFAIPQRQNEAEPTVQTTIRVTDAQLEAIDGLASTHSSNRSQIVAAALRLHFKED